MKKQVSVTLKTKDETLEYKTNAILNQEKNTLSWIETDALKTHMILDFQNKNLIRENKELKMILTFDKKKDKIMNCKLKGLKKEFRIKIEIPYLKIEENSFEITYHLKETELEKEEHNLTVSIF